MQKLRHEKEIFFCSFIQGVIRSSVQRQYYPIEITTLILYQFEFNGILPFKTRSVFQLAGS